MEAAFFDLDKTVIAKPSLVAFGRPLYDAGMISRWLVLRALWSNMLFHYLGADEERMRKFRQSALRITRGWDQALVSAIVRDTLHEVIEPIVYAEAFDLIREHQRVGRRVYLISASPEEIVAPLAQFLGVDEAIASRAQLDTDGRYTGDVEFWSYGPYKAQAVRDAATLRGIDLSKSYAYSDSATDIPMLELVGNPVAVNPDRELARVARERNWEVCRFEQEVPLRARVNMPPPSKALGVLGALIAVAAATTGAWWWISRSRHATTASAAEAMTTSTRVAKRARSAARVAGRPLRALAGSTRSKVDQHRWVDQGRRAAPSIRLKIGARWETTSPAASSQQKRRVRAGRRER